MALVIVITNVSNLAPISDYNYEVIVGDGTTAHSKTLAKGTVTRHVRIDGWQALVERVLQQNPLPVPDSPK